MKREILQHKRYKHVSGCCPGHDSFPDDHYNSRRSFHARSRDKKREHRYARHLSKQSLRSLHD